MIAGTIVLLLLVLLALRMPVGFAMAVSGTLGLYWKVGIDPVMGFLASMPHQSAAIYEFITIPMFLLMAEFVLRSGIAEDLFRTASAWFGRVPGGLGVATAVSGAGFGAICGSSTASAATLSSTSLTAMLKYGYEPRMAAGAVAISGTLSMLIPPSIAMVVYGLLADVSIAQLLIAGVIPGILVTMGIALTIVFLAIRDPSCAPLADKFTWAEKFRLLKLVGPMLLLLFSVTVVIYTGVATPTEASALGALMSAILYFARGRRTAREVFDLIARATRTACMIGIILLGAHIFATFFALTQTTQGLVAWVGSLPVEPWMIVGVLVLIYLILGCFLDQMAILVLTVPVAAPLILALDYDLIWFGVIVIVTAELGMVTPPLGLNAFVVSKYSKVPVREVFIGIVPHFVTHVGIILMLLLIPALSLWLPSMM